MYIRLASYAVQEKSGNENSDANLGAWHIIFSEGDPTNFKTRWTVKQSLIL
jgi:hypothetical protein